MSGTVKVIKVLNSKAKSNVLNSKDISKVKAKPSFEGGRFVVRVGDLSPRKDAEIVGSGNSKSTPVAKTNDAELSSSSSSVPKVCQVEKTEDHNVEAHDASIPKESQEHTDSLIAVSSSSQGEKRSRFVSRSLGQVKTFVHAPARHVLDIDAGSPETCETPLRLPVESKAKAVSIGKTSLAKPMPRRVESSEAPSLADPCCYPPSDRTVHLLKMLAAAEILSIKELAEIVAYITYLRRRKLVTDYLLKEGIGNDIEAEMDPEPDDEPPLVQSSVRFPVKTEKRSFGPDETNSPPSKMPHLMEVLKRPSNVAALMNSSADVSHWPFNVVRGSPTMRSSGADAAEQNRSRAKLRPKKVMAACEMCGSRVNEKQIKAHSRTCRGVIVKRRKQGGGPDEAEELRERACPRCEKVLACDRDFEMHMAVAHKFYWRLDFDNEAEFGQWFREEGLDETMIAGPSKTHEDIHEKVFYCAINGGARMKVKCPCRLAIKRGPNGVVARYSVLHNHAERFVRQQMSNECRNLILDMLKQGLRNYEILKTIKQTYPKTSMNYLVTSQAITRLRYRFHHTEKSPTGRREGRRRGRKPARSENAAEAGGPRAEPFGADFGEDKPTDAVVWPLPEIQCAAMGLSATYAEAEGGLMH